MILGVFHNEGFDQTVTLAQVFWMKEMQGQPQRFYIGAEKTLGIKQDFAGFGSDIVNLRKRLRKHGCEVLDSFPPYGALFRRRFGIDNDQALERKRPDCKNKRRHESRQTSAMERQKIPAAAVA